MIKLSVTKPETYENANMYIKAYLDHELCVNKFIETRRCCYFILTELSNEYAGNAIRIREFGARLRPKVMR